MSKIETSTHLKGILGKISYTKEVIDLILSLRKFDSSEIARQRMKIIKFYETYGRVSGAIPQFELICGRVSSRVGKRRKK